MSHGFSESEFIKLREKSERHTEDIARLQEKVTAAAAALEIARQTMESYKITNNEWRQENLDQRSLFPTEDKVRGLIDALAMQVNMLKENRQEEMGRHAGLNSVWVAVTVGGALFLTAIGIVVALITHPWGH